MTRRSSAGGMASRSCTFLSLHPDGAAGQRFRMLLCERGAAREPDFGREPPGDELPLGDGAVAACIALASRSCGQQRS